MPLYEGLESQVHKMGLYRAGKPFVLTLIFKHSNGELQAGTQYIK